MTAPGDLRALLAEAERAHAAGSLDAALAGYRQALPAAPAGGPAAGIAHNIGLVLQALGRTGDAEVAYRTAIEHDPRLVDPYLSLSEILRETGRPWDALELLNRSLAHTPNARVLVNIAAHFQVFGQAVEAEAAVKAALEFGPELPEAHNILGAVLRDRGDTAAAIPHFRRAVELAPQRADLLSNLLFSLCFLEGTDPLALYREHLTYNERHIVPLRPRRRRPEPVRDPERRLRVGYVSADFRRHVGGHFLMPLLRPYDRARFEVTVYYNALVEDDVTAQMRGLVNRWRVCATMNDAALADQIVADGIDILVECTGHMAGTRLPMFGLKPAPLQFSVALYPNTTGVETIDRRFLDPHVAPEGADALHSEALVRLPDTHVCYAPLPDDVPACDTPPFIRNGYVTFGSFNNFAKLGPSTLAAWARILDAVPGARLRLKWIGVRESGRDVLQQRFAAAGLDPARIDLIEWEAHPYPAYRELDICLDPFFSNGGTTTCDALWMGVPVVTRRGDTLFARVGLCHLHNIGLPDLIAETADDYVRIATELATDRDRLAELHRTLRERMRQSPITDERRYIQHVEAAYRQAWREFCIVKR